MWWANSLSVFDQWAKTLPRDPISDAEVSKSTRLEGHRAIINRENVHGSCEEIRMFPDGVGRLDWSEGNFGKIPKTANLNLYGFELHDSLIKGTKLPFQVMKAPIIMSRIFKLQEARKHQTTRVPTT